MKFRIFALLCVVSVLLLITVGCGNETPTPTAVAEDKTTEQEAAGPSQAQPTSEDEEPSPTAKAQPTLEPTSEGDEETTPPASIVDLDSYRQVVKTVSVDQDGNETGWEITIEFVREPPAMRTISRSTAGDEESFVSEMIQISNTTYIKTGDEWIVMQSSEGDISETTPGYMDIASYTDTEGCDDEGTENVNDMQTRHYHCDASYLVGLPATFGEGELLESESDTWVSTEYNIAVRTSVAQKYKDADDNITEWRVESDITDINEEIIIEAPEGVEETGLPDDIPLIDGATEVSSMMGMTSFKVTATPEEIADFYQEAMSDNGWTFSAENSFVPNIFNFTKDERTANIYLSPEDTQTSVTIMVE